MGNKNWQPKYEVDALLWRIVNGILLDSHNEDDYFTDDEGNSWHVDDKSNPYSEDFDPDFDPEGIDFNPISDTYPARLCDDDLDGKDISYALLNEYLYTSFPHDSDHIKTMTFVIFSRLMKIDFSDVLDLVAMHPTKHSTTGLSKLQKELQGVNKKVFTDVVMDYIAMMKEAGMPSINEEHLMATKDRYSTLAEFWHIYGAMAFLLEDAGNPKIPGMLNENANSSALERFKKKITDDKNVLYPLLAYLYSQWAEEDKWLKQTEDIQDAIPDGLEGASTYMVSRLGYAGLMYARDNLENPRNRDKQGANVYKNREADWNEFIESKAEDLNTFIKNKYFT